jgi:hypothetical protein
MIRFDKELFGIYFFHENVSVYDINCFPKMETIKYQYNKVTNEVTCMNGDNLLSKEKLLNQTPPATAEEAAQVIQKTGIRQRALQALKKIVLGTAIVMTTLTAAHSADQLNNQVVHGSNAIVNVQQETFNSERYIKNQIDQKVQNAKKNAKEFTEALYPDIPTDKEYEKEISYRVIKSVGEDQGVVNGGYLMEDKTIYLSISQDIIKSITNQEQADEYLVLFESVATHEYQHAYTMAKGLTPSEKYAIDSQREYYSSSPSASLPNTVMKAHKEQEMSILNVQIEDTKSQLDAFVKHGIMTENENNKYKELLDDFKAHQEIQIQTRTTPSTFKDRSLKTNPNDVFAGEYIAGVLSDKDYNELTEGFTQKEKTAFAKQSALLAYVLPKYLQQKGLSIEEIRPLAVAGVVSQSDYLETKQILDKEGELVSFAGGKINKVEAVFFDTNSKFYNLIEKESSTFGINPLESIGKLTQSLQDQASKFLEENKLTKEEVVQKHQALFETLNQDNPSYGWK